MLSRNNIVLLLVVGFFLGTILGLFILQADDGLLNLPDFSAKSEGPYLQSGAPAVGKLAPDFEAQDLFGETVALNQYRGKNVLVNFWATWCSPCRLEMPLFEALHTSNSQDIQILAVNSGESETEVRKFADELGLTFSLILDPYESIRSNYRVVGLPVSVFINKDGIITAQHIGAMSEEQLIGYIDLLGDQN